MRICAEIRTIMMYAQVPLGRQSPHGRIPRSGIGKTNVKFGSSMLIKENKAPGHSYAQPRRRPAEKGRGRRSSTNSEGYAGCGLRHLDAQ